MITPWIPRRTTSMKMTRAGRPRNQKIPLESEQRTFYVDILTEDCVNNDSFDGVSPSLFTLHSW